MRTASKPWIALALVALTLVAFVERWAGLGFLLPHGREADTAMVHVAALHDLPKGMEPNDAAYRSTIYPLFFPLVLIALPGSNYPVAQAADAPIEAHLAAASEPYMRGRRMIALLSLLMIPCTYFLARRWLEPGWSVFAAALATTCLLALKMAQEAKPHGGLSGTSALALVGVLGLLRSGTWRAYLFAGLSSALSVASLESGCFVLPSLGLAHLIAWRADRDHKRWIWLAIALALCAGSFVLAYPFLVFHDPLRSSGKETLNLGQQTIDWGGWKGEGFPDMLPWMWVYDPTLIVLAFVALGAVVWRLTRREGSTKRAPRPETLVFGLHALITIGLFGLHERFYPRYMLPVVPFLCIVGAVGLRSVADALSGFTPSPAARRALGITLAVLALALPTFASFWFARLRARDDTPILAARWVEAHIPPDSGAIALDFSLSLPLLQQRAALLEMPGWTWQPWQRYQVEVMPDDVRGTRWNLRPIFEQGMMVDRKIDREEVRKRLAKIDAKWAIVAVPAPADAERDETRLALQAIAGEPIARILPFGPSGSLDSILTRESDTQFLAHVLRLDRLGQPIEIYRLP